MNDDYRKGFADGWKAAMEANASRALAPAISTTEIPALDPCANCGPVCGNVACPKRPKVTC